MTAEGKYIPVKLVHFDGDGDWVPLADATNDIALAKRIAMAYAAGNKGYLGAGVLDESYFVHEVTARGWRHANDKQFEPSAA